IRRPLRHFKGEADPGMSRGAVQGSEARNIETRVIGVTAAGPWHNVEYPADLRRYEKLMVGVEPVVIARIDHAGKNGGIVELFIDNAVGGHSVVVEPGIAQGSANDINGQLGSAGVRLEEFAELEPACQRHFTAIKD